MAKLVTWECDCGGLDGKGCKTSVEFATGGAPDGWRFVTVVVATNNRNEVDAAGAEPKCGKRLCYLAPDHHLGAHVQAMLLEAMQDAFTILSLNPKRLPR